ncbi:OLC1v1037895C2 [Oldenlandia corymbosa var. corymbosa]|uniref:OLC1v1037895C2 n=1 Tax=Oldenlandia corymbosa var. corymbosa TaxID=529605 RepID=A0AAV1CZP2_OLDCO|nr:OLC1v1037895C2 [Oldenlandia corymbosa var. corymbosa]
MGRKNSKTVWQKKNSKMVWRKKEPSPLPAPWTELPLDIAANILKRLDVVDILEAAQRVCTTWRSVCKDPSMWQKIDMSKHTGYEDFDSEIMCKHLVDRSQGQLVDVRVGFFGTDDLLAHIAERSGQLRCLLLASCCAITGYGLTEAVKRFPLLEELHLFSADVPSESIEIVGRSCPLLKSFSFGGVAPFPDKKDFRVRELECNNEALSIAKTMPRLQYLDLFGNALTNDGLVAILDGCTHLETLDLRRCFGVNLEGNIGKQCTQQLKCLRLPDDSVEDHEYYDRDCFDDYGFGWSGSDGSDFDEDHYLDYEDYDDYSLWAAMNSDYEDFFLGGLVIDDHNDIY